MKYPARILYYGAVLLWCLLLAGCSQQKTPDNSVRLGYLQNDLHHLPAFVALEKKFFKDEGLNVTVAGVFKAGPELMSAFGSGDLDCGYVGQAPATAAVLNNVAKVKFIAQVNREGSALVIQSDDPAASFADLQGKSVAIPGHATMQDFLLRRAARTSGISFETLRIIVLKPPEMLQALSQKQIAAFISWEPYPAQAVSDNNGKILLTSSQIWPSHPCCVLVASETLCRTRPATVRKILAAHQRACAFISDNPEAAISIGMQYTGMARATVAAALKHIVFDPALDREKAGEFVEFLKDLRYIQSHAPEKSLNDVLYD